jgi:DNA ligase-1
MAKAKQYSPVIGTFIPTMQPGYYTPEEVMEAHKQTTQADIKYDGYRTQIHKKGSQFKIFTRNGNELEYECYPEITEIVKKLPSGIIEAELLGQGKTHKETFDNIKKRFRKPGLSEVSKDKYFESGIIKSTPLQLRVFDVLQFEGKNYMDLPLHERRRKIETFEEYGILPAETTLITSEEELLKVLEDTFAKRLEGRVCKDPQSKYIPDNNKSIEWVKFKRSESLDLVVVGTYNEPSYNTQIPCTSVLCAAYNRETKEFETLGKIGVTRNGLINKLYPMIEKKLTIEIPENLSITEKLIAQTKPVKYVNPLESIVLEINAMNIDFTQNNQACGREHSKAYSLRIAYAKEIREDKKPIQATTTQDIIKLYQMQKGE